MAAKKKQAKKKGAKPKAAPPPAGGKGGKGSAGKAEAATPRSGGKSASPEKLKGKEEAKGKEASKEKPKTDLAPLKKKAEEGKATFEKVKAEADALRAKAGDVEAAAKKAYAEAVAPYRDACRKAGVECELAGGRASNVTPTFNGKVERFFRTLRGWSSVLLMAYFADKVTTCRWFQRRLDTFKDWYNEARLHQALGGRTPDEVWEGRPHNMPARVRASDPQPEVTVKRKWFRGDHHLPVFDIQVRRSA